MSETRPIEMVMRLQMADQEVQLAGSAEDVRGLIAILQRFPDLVAATHCSIGEVAPSYSQAVDDNDEPWGPKRRHPPATYPVFTD